MRKATPILYAGAAILVASACSERRPGGDVTAKQPAEARCQVALTPVTQPKTVQVTRVDRDGKPVGPPRSVQLTPEANPAEMGLSPVPAGSP